MAVIKKNKVLSAFTCAALGLPGMEVKSAVPTVEAEVNLQYGYYKEQGERMRAEVFHSDFVIPFADRLENK